MRSVCLLTMCSLSLAATVLLAAAGEGASFRAAVEADWLLQDRVRKAGPVVRGKPPTSPDDAAGAVDGVKDGKWGFHTLEDKRPWWQVDLGQPVALDRVVVYNRCDNTCPERNRQIELALSADGKSWQVAYRHAGKPAFGGIGFGKPLEVKLGGKPARFVRLQHPTPTWFHLDEVEVYAAADTKRNIALGKPANQSSASKWSRRHDRPVVAGQPTSFPFATVLARGQKLAADLLDAGAPVQPLAARLDALAQRAKALPQTASLDEQRKLYFDIRWTIRRIALANPLLDFDRIFITKRRPASFTHMSDQYYG
ncbi:discoidin domain-containing protein, partial [bacterium]|nr:discoidin domain-containing protein [bacterium]